MAHRTNTGHREGSTSKSRRLMYAIVNYNFEQYDGQNSKPVQQVARLSGGCQTPSPDSSPAKNTWNSKLVLRPSTVDYSHSGAYPSSSLPETPMRKAESAGFSQDSSWLASAARRRCHWPALQAHSTAHRFTLLRHDLTTRTRAYVDLPAPLTCLAWPAWRMRSSGVGARPSRLMVRSLEAPSPGGAHYGVPASIVNIRVIVQPIYGLWMGLGPTTGHIRAKNHPAPHLAVPPCGSAAASKTPICAADAVYHYAPPVAYHRQPYRSCVRSPRRQCPHSIFALLRFAAAAASPPTPPALYSAHSHTLSARLRRHLGPVHRQGLPGIYAMRPAPPVSHSFSAYTFDGGRTTDYGAAPTVPRCPSGHGFDAMLHSAVLRPFTLLSCTPELADMTFTLTLDYRMYSPRSTLPVLPITIKDPQESSMIYAQPPHMLTAFPISRCFHETTINWLIHDFRCSNRCDGWNSTFSQKITALSTSTTLEAI
ncbi:hypothetical protein C8R43DRAFT_949309 [Mycena crocata]|nr:hypothetical protein C8R43DRAFT_949309 [Mycena crocata]